MVDMIHIMSINDYVEKFGQNGVGKGLKVDLVKAQIIDTFRKEIFDQICFKLRIGDISEAKETPKNKEIVENILKQSYKKWLWLIRAFNKYRETHGMLKPDDLDLLKDQNEMYDPFDGFDDDDEQFCEAEDPIEEEHSNEQMPKTEEFSEVATGDNSEKSEREATENGLGASK